jgi:hypothetical protein
MTEGEGYAFWNVAAECGRPVLNTKVLGQVSYFLPEDGSKTLLRNACVILPSYTE